MSETVKIEIGWFCSVESNVPESEPTIHGVFKFNHQASDYLLRMHDFHSDVFQSEYIRKENGEIHILTNICKIIPPVEEKIDIDKLIDEQLGI